MVTYNPHRSTEEVRQGDRTRMNRTVLVVSTVVVIIAFALIYWWFAAYGGGHSANTGV